MSFSRALLRTGVVLLGSTTLVLGLVSAPAVAAPETPPLFPSGSSATQADRHGFDTCAAPSLAALRAWRNTSPHNLVNIYFGGRNRACQQPNLTRAWVRDAHAMGWRLLPTYMGYQPSCMYGSKPYLYTAGNATSRGRSDANDAITQARALGLLPGSALYADVEHYNRSNSSCRTAVLRYVSAWTTTLHASGYLAGVYVHQDSGLRDLSANYNSSTYARPDAVWMARWDGNAALTGWPTASNSQWSNWQRAKQYRGDHNETWGGVTLNIDSNRVKGPVATVARSFTVTSSTPLNARRGPSTSNSVVRSYQPGASMPVVCQSRGDRVGTTAVWNLLSNGTWVSDYYTSTPSNTGFSSTLPRCMYPAQVTTSSLNARTGPGTSYRTTGSPLSRGALAYVTCQRSGTRVGTTSIWNQMRDGRWVSDYYVATPSNTGYSANIPRCR